jgi:hypothetical protein
MFMRFQNLLSKILGAYLPRITRKIFTIKLSWIRSWLKEISKSLNDRQGKAKRLYIVHRDHSSSWGTFRESCY